MKLTLSSVAHQPLISENQELKACGQHTGTSKIYKLS
jgi:hypothetical protein